MSGWDRVDTPYLTPVRAAGIPRCLSPYPPEPPDGWEVVVSTAYADRVSGRSRADFLAELVSLQRAIVVAGVHGKTTTAAMITFCLDRLGLDLAWLIGAEVPQLGANAEPGAAGSSSKETSRTGPSQPSRPRSPCSPTSTSTTTPPSPRAPSSRRCSRSGSRACPGSCAGVAATVSRAARCGRRAQPPQRRVRARRARLAGVAAEDAVGARRVSRRKTAPGTPRSGAASPFWTTTPTIRRSSGRRSTPPASVPGSRARRLPAAPLLAYAAPGAGGRRRARSCRRRLRDRDLRGARGAPDRRLRKAGRRCRLRGPPGDAARWTPQLADAARFLARRARAGDVVLDTTPAISTGCPTWCWRRSRDRARVALDRFTSLGTGGPARAFARPRTLDQLLDVLRWAADEGIPRRPSAWVEPARRGRGRRRARREAGG